MEANPEKFSDSKEVQEMRVLMNLALQTLEYRIRELDKMIYMQGNFKPKNGESNNGEG